MALANESRNAVVTDWFWAEGTFRQVGLGVYTKGPRRNQRCVVKRSKMTSSVEFDGDLKAVDLAIRIVEQFNAQGLANVFMNRPEVWQIDASKEKLLVEPFIDNFKKFNSNSGWKSDEKQDDSLLMQSLSHFSYHVTEGQCVLCDLQGGVAENRVVLTDPVVLSRTNNFGKTDLGHRGIDNFFSTHICNKFCRPFWKRPRNAMRYFNVTPSTAGFKDTVATTAPPLLHRANSAPTTPTKPFRLQPKPTTPNITYQ